jgi:hypothetical protein
MRWVFTVSWDSAFRRERYYNILRELEDADGHAERTLKDLTRRE